MDANGYNTEWSVVRATACKGSSHNSEIREAAGRKGLERMGQMAINGEMVLRVEEACIDLRRHEARRGSVSD